MAGIGEPTERPAPQPVVQPSRQKRGKAAKTPKKAAAVTKVARLAQEARGDGPTTWIFTLERLPRVAEGSLSCVGGPGFDLAERQPSHEDLPMTHVLTLDLADLPDLESRFPGARAVALYVSEPRGNDACEPHTDETSIVALSDADVARGSAPKSGEELPFEGVRATRVEVPASTFDSPTPHAKLLRAIVSSPARAGGRPFWLQDDLGDDRFVLQFSEKFAPINLGDAGLMYVFEDTAFWQSR